MNVGDLRGRNWGSNDRKIRWEFSKKRKRRNKNCFENISEFLIEKKVGGKSE